MFWRRKHRNDDLERELRSHLDLESEEQEELGLSADEARYAACRNLGNATRLKEEVREMWGWPKLEQLLQDFGYALRMMRKSPGFTFTAILSLALGIGANTAVFTVVNAVLLAPLPYPQPDRLVVIWDREIHVKEISKLFGLYVDYDNWRKNSGSFAQVAAFSWSQQASPQKILTAHGPARTVFTLPVTPDFFSVLQVRAMLGRTFNESDRGHGCLAVVAHSFWRTVLTSDKAVVGKPLRLDDQVCTVVGVMPPGFAFLPPDAPVSMWISMQPPVRPSEFAVGVIARLRPSVSLSAAQAELSLLQHHIHEHDLWGVKMKPVLYGLHEEFTWLTGRNLRLTLLVLFAAVNLVILICCVNVANLLLARAVGRQREMVIRAALGSGRGRLLRQLFAENLLLAFLATALGVALAAGAVQYVRIAAPIALPPATNLALNVPVLAFTVLLGLMTAIVFGLLPAWRASRVDLNEALKASGRTISQGTRQRGFGKTLIIAEVTLTVILLAGAGLLLKTLNRFASAPLGFTPNGLLTTSIRLSPATYKKPGRRLEFYRELEAQLSELPGIKSVALSNKRPIDCCGPVDVVEVQGHPRPRLSRAFDTLSQTVSSDYFRVMRIRLLEGRFFKRFDNQHSEPVAIINQALVQKYLPNEDPIGKYIRPFSESQTSNPWIKVVGIVADEKRTTVYQEMMWADSPMIYRPLEQEPNANKIIVRTAQTDTIGLGTSIERAVSRIDPDVPVERLASVESLEAQVLAYPRFRAMLLAAFAVLALVLSVIGLLGVLSHSVAQRTHEMGVRLALGAPSRALLIMILREGLTLTLTGLVFGFGLALLLGKYLAALLYGVQPGDPALLAAIALVVLMTTMAAVYIPARRASKADPIVALRYE